MTKATKKRAVAQVSACVHDATQHKIDKQWMSMKEINAMLFTSNTYKRNAAIKNCNHNNNNKKNIPSPLGTQRQDHNCYMVLHWWCVFMFF